ncbi:glycosyltransferase [Methanobrevibacter sp. OttesenSCG-928-K11]|nr:glycosyltransferase [Methanobrevibacter sp. OttesenSCG-928-K11]MDL2270383.1 glycosyltransferase [Methanobrevibacter sp. OttesenSCG-928-I08]
MSWMLVILVFLLAFFKPNKLNKDLTISVIIPAYNEEDTVAKVVNVIKKISYIDEIVVVDDGSTDNTAENAKKAGAKVISHDTNLGKGAAIKTGFKKTDSDIIAFIDADIYNLTPEKIETIIIPILEGKTEITKTKFARESGRVTELTAKPLLKFFFPEITFEQPLSGQFAAKRSVLKKMSFEKDYGVDVGIVLDADIKGIKIQEVDIGEIEHDLSPLKDLNLMANEVVRTIIDRALEYGRVTIIDTIGSYIRMAILGLSLIILGLFAIFFVQQVPLELGVIVSAIGLIIAIYYLIKLLIKSIKMFRKNPGKNLAKSFIKIHFPIIISGVILVLMISTFLSATTFDGSTISIEPSSRNLLIFSDDSDNTISVRGPYTIDSAIENESHIIRLPESALDTLEMGYGDTVIINNQEYTINNTRDGEPNIMRLPLDVQNFFDVDIGNVIQNSRIIQIFDGTSVHHMFRNNSNENSIENFVIHQKTNNMSTYEVFLNNKSIGSSSGIFINGTNYQVSSNGEIIGSFNFEKNSSHLIFFDNNTLEIKFKDSNYTSIKNFISSDEGSFLEVNF